MEPFADQPPSASPLPWTVPTGAKTHLFDCVCRAYIYINNLTYLLTYLLTKQPEETLYLSLSANKLSSSDFLVGLVSS